MGSKGDDVSPLPRHQQRIRDKCWHPTGTIIAFRPAAIEGSIPACFEAHVHRDPHRLAVKTSAHEFSYEALNSMANRIAHTILARRGEGAEPVALLFDPNAPLLATILGVLKAGKSYVPLEPALPRTRLTALLADLQAGLIITDSQYFPLASALVDDRYQLLNVEEIEADTAVANLGQSPAPDSLAGIIYTSGSTGQPKGVMQDHRHILHNVMNHTNSFRLCADDRLIVLASSITAQVMAYIYSALLNGAGVYLLDIKQDGLFQVADWLSQHDITIYCSIPTVFRAFLGTLHGGEWFPALRLIHVGGEPVYQKDIDLYKRLFRPSCLFVNRLGLTETGSIRWYFIDQETTLTDSVVPVGYAVEGAEILILDAAGQRVGVDCIGEIAVKSRYLTRGYWRNLELTQAACAADPTRSQHLDLSHG